MDHKHKVIVIGGGISGLTTAFLLKNNNTDVLLIEEKDTPGGNIKSIEQDGFRMETGPHSFMGSSENVWNLVHTLNCNDCVVSAASVANNRYIYRNEKLHPLPLGIKSFLKTSLLSLRGKLRLAMEPLIKNGAQENDTAWDFFCRRFGREAATYIMSHFISGIYAGDAKLLGARAAFPKFWEFEKNSGSMIRGAFKYMKQKKERLGEGKKVRKGLFSFNEGLGQLTSILAHKLGNQCVTGAPVSMIDKTQNGYQIVSNGKKWSCESIILTTPPHIAGNLLENLAPGIKILFDLIPMAPVILVHWSVKDPENRFPRGFGFLMPRIYDFHVLGTLFPSQLFEQRAPDGIQLFSSFYGGMTDKNIIDLDDNEITEIVFTEHKSILKSELDDAEIVKILRYPAAIPQLLPDHNELVDSIRNTLAEKLPGFFLAGNYLSGVGIEHAVTSGFKAFDEYSQSLDKTHI